MAIPEFNKTQYLSTMISPMTDVTETAEPLVDILPVVRYLVGMKLIPPLVEKKHLVKAVYRNKPGTFDHVLLPTGSPDSFICLIVNNHDSEIAGYYFLDLAKEYSLSGARMTRIEELACEGATAALQELLGSGYSQEEIDRALGDAIAYSRLETADYLLYLGADLAADGYNGVYYAAHNDELEGLKFAISKGVDVNIEKGMLLNTAVETACNTKSCTMIEWLLQQGASIEWLSSIQLARDWGTDELRMLIGMAKVAVVHDSEPRTKASSWWKFW